MKRSIHFFLLLFCLMNVGNCIAGSPLALTTITTLPVGPISCQGEINVSFTIDAPADAGNVFTAQLSNQFGSFINPVNIGTLNSTSAGTIMATIPSSTLNGLGYRIRVISSSPNVMGSDNGSDIIIDLLPQQLTILGGDDGAGGFCGFFGLVMVVDNFSGPGYTYQWQLDGVDIPGATLDSYFTFDGGNYTVVVTNSSGCSAQSAVFTAFNYQGQSTIFANSTQICPGGFITLEGDGLTGTWYFNGNMIGSLSDNFLQVTVPGNYQWQRHPLSGCDEIISDPVTVTMLSASFTTLASSYHLNAAPVTLTGNPAGGTFSGPGITGNTFDPAAAGVGGPYTITYSYDDQGPFSSCTVVVSQQTSVTQACTPPPAVITPNGPTTFCQNGSVVLNANTGTGLTYQWFRGSIGITAATSSSLIVGISGDYTVVVTDASGCSATSAQVSVTVNSLPVVSFTGLAANYTVNDPPVTLTGSPAGGTFSGFGVTGNTFNPATALIGMSDTVHYVYTNANGCTNSSFQITFVTQGCIPPPAVITMGGPTTFCEGGATSMFANTGTGFTYQWQLNGVDIPAATTGFLLVFSSGDYTVVVTDATGCSATSAPVTITVNPHPVVSFTGLAGSYSVTDPPVTLTGIPAGGVFEGTGISGNTFDPSLANIGTDTVRYTYTDPNGCPGSDQQITIVTQGCTPPNATISQVGPITICDGDDVLLNANTGAGLTYQWQLNGIDIVGANSSMYIANAAGDYTVVVSSGAGCSTTSAPVTLLVNPLPVVSFTGLLGTYSITASPVTLTGVPAGGIFSGPGISGNTFDPAAAGVGGPYTIVYGYTNINGCSNTSEQQTTVTTVVCNVPPVPGSISTANGGTSVCPGDIKTYTINPVNGALSYTWIAPPGAAITGGQGTLTATVTYNSGFTTGDSLRVTANNSCGSSAARGRKINRKAPPSPPLAITGPVNEICNVAGVPYSVIPDAGMTYTWSWNTGGVSIVSGQGTDAVTCDFTTSFITGKISVTATNSCGTSTPRNLVVNAKPAAPGMITGSVGVCAGQQAVPYSISPVINAASYIWYAPTAAHINDGTTTSSGNSLATTATNVQVNFSGTGGAVRVKAVNACAAGSTTTLPVSIVCRTSLPATGIANEQSTGIYPNPSNGHFRIMVGNVQKMVTVKIRIMDQFGQIVYQADQKSNNGMVDVDVLGRIANGIYMVSCIVDGETIVKKLMISK